MKKTLLVLCTISMCSNIVNAGVYVKGYLGNVLSSTEYQHDIDTTYAGVIGNTQEIIKQITSNQFTPGLSLGLNWNVSPSVKFGFEFDARKQFDKVQFTEMEATGATLLYDTALLKFENENQFKLVFSPVITIIDKFYFKVGPSLLKQKITGTIRESQPTSEVVKGSEKKDLLGVTAGGGFIYKLSKDLGIVSEYNYSWYKKKSLSDFVLDDSVFASIAAGDFEHHKNRHLKTSQSELFVGLHYSFT